MHISTSHAVESQAPAVSQERLALTTPPTRAAEREANPEAQDARPSKSVNPSSEAARLSESDLRQVEQLKARDREVRAHEQAHLAAGGSLTRGGARYTYEQGPDGKRYAVGGEVSIESARVPGDPEATAERAAQVQRAATAPASPSAQDRAVAAEAAAVANEARAEIRAEAREASREAAESTAPSQAAEPMESVIGESAIGEPAIADAAQDATAAESAADAGTESTQPPDREAERFDAAANANLSLYESVDAIKDGRPSSPSMFEPVMA